MLRGGAPQRDRDTGSVTGVCCRTIAEAKGVVKKNEATHSRVRCLRLARE